MNFNKKNKKILVTGAAGFIGLHLCLRLLGEGYEVVGLDNINSYYAIELKYGRLSELGIEADEIKCNALIGSNSFPNFKFIQANLENKATINNLFSSQNFDKVCHLAAQAGVRYSLINPEAYIQSNVVGFLNILEACRHHTVKALTYASSSSVYGMNEKQPFSTSDDVDHPISIYAASKKANELMAHTYSHLYGLPTTGLRFFTVYGPWGRPDMSPFLFTKAIIEDKPIDVYNNGNMQRDFTYIDDIIQGVMKVIESQPNEDKNSNSSSVAPYKIYNIGNSSPVNLMDFISAIERKLDKKAKKNFLPMQPGDVLSTWADTKDLEKDFDYKPNTDIQAGINHFIDWYKKFYNI